MNRLNNEEMIEVKGGAFAKTLIGLVGAGIVFLIGVIDGLINPRKCNS